MEDFKLLTDERLSIIEQVAQTIAKDIDRGVLKKNDKMPSINEFNKRFEISRDTIWKAYKLLEKRNYLFSKSGKGIYVKGKQESRLKIVLIFNKLSSYKKLVYDSFLNTVGEKAIVDLYIHQYNPTVLQDIIEKVKGNYHYYVIMPHFFWHCKPKTYLPVLNEINSNELVLLDKEIKSLRKVSMCVYQDFEKDIFEALSSEAIFLSKYHHIVLILSSFTHHPQEIIKGIKMYCNNTQTAFSLNPSVSNKLLPGALYIVIEDEDLANIIKLSRRQKFDVGKDFGIIAFNETVLKEILDITVVTTDFKQMGSSVANMILNGDHDKLRNPFFMIKRGSI